MARVYNFSAGPSTLPESVLEIARAEMLDYGGSGMSVMEMSHRGKVFEGIIAEAESLLRELMNIPANYRVLFLQGGASMQFSMVPMNLMVNKKAQYAITGNFAVLATKEAAKLGEVSKITSSEAENHTAVPLFDDAMVAADMDYVHITTNNTIFGTRYPSIPKIKKAPLVADMSSNILAEEFDVTDFGLIYAGAQKNIGPAGVTIVIVRDDLLERSADTLPSMLNYKLMAKNGSLYNTPTCYSIYIAMLVFRWLKAQGGVAAISAVNARKAGYIYDVLDQSSYYRPKAQKGSRSLMNVTFTTPSEEEDDAFVKAAAKEGMAALKGHRLTGGIRASIYNAMPEEGCKKLAAFMRAFEQGQVK